MAYYNIPDPETLISCPYDKVHMVAAKRMQYHLMKCRKNFTGREYATCPFNARHEMPKPELRYHIANCPDKAMLEPILSYEQSKMSEEGKNFKGCTDLPKYDDYHARNSENWDEEIPENPRIGVDPSYFARMDYKDFTGMSRSEKKTWKKQLNLPPEQRQYPVNTEKEKEEETQLRKPHTMPSKFMQPQQIQQPSQVLSYSLAMAGIGRGGTGLTGQSSPGVGRAMGRGESGLGRGAGRGEQLPSAGRAAGRGDNLPGVGKAMGRASAINNYAQNNILNGLSNGTNQTSTEDKTERLNGQYDDVSPQEKKMMEVPYSQPAGIGRGRGASPPAAFTVGMGRGMLREMQLNGNPSFVVPKVSPTESAFSSSEQEGDINADALMDAKNKERKKIEKKLKQIEFLEEKQNEGYKFNTDEVLKIQAKGKLLDALEKLQL